MIALTIDAANKIADFCSNYGAEIIVRESYSGRGMYGKTCVAFECSSEDECWIYFSFGYLSCENDEEISLNGISVDDMPIRRDSIGLGIIVY